MPGLRRVQTENERCTAGADRRHRGRRRLRPRHPHHPTKDTISHRGENIYDVEIEERLVQHDAIAGAATIGVRVADGVDDFKASAYVEPETDRLRRNTSGELLEGLLRGDGVISSEGTT